jgi:elongation factor G
MAKNVKNIAVIGHSGVGKTSLVDAVLFSAKVSNRLGRVDDGTSLSDYTAEEIKRKMSISTSVNSFEWQGCLLNILDTPGFADFVGDIKGGLRVADAALVVLDAVSGVEVGTERVWQYSEEYNLPKIIFVNRMDKENADYNSVCKMAGKAWGNKVVSLQVPFSQDGKLSGVIDLINMKVNVDKEKEAGNISIEDIPEDFKSIAEKAREKLLEQIAESNDKLLEKYLEEGALSDKEIISGLKEGIASGQIIPITCGSAYNNIGISALLNILKDYSAGAKEIKGTKPGTEEEIVKQGKPDEAFSAFVFKTVSESHIGELTYFRVFSGKISSGKDAQNVNQSQSERIGQLLRICGKERIDVDSIEAGEIGAVAKLKATKTGDTLCDKKTPILYKGVSLPQPMVSFALKPDSKKDQEKLGTILSKIRGEDPSLKVHMDPEFSQTVISGMGELHIDIINGRIKDKYGVNVSLEKTRVPYRETIRTSVKIQGKYKKQSGGRGQYGDVWLEIEPLSREGDNEFEFENKIRGGAIPARFIPSVEKGVKGALKKGILAGYQVIYIKTSLYDGTFHTVDSSDMAFQVAGSMAFKKGVEQAKPVLLEPIMDVEISVPEENLGDISADVNSRRGRILGIEPKLSTQVVKAQIPLAELDRYSTDLKSMTQGKASFSMSFSSYEEISGRIADKVIAEAKAAKEEKEK